ncbi:hypothetical protein GALL_276670 [mine drainage metagenome]|uniref:Transporter n=1 Tax=mine drainage metagenome TaxID=410659 RepID=A0A1J5R3C3_9ZZZZ
MKISHFITMLVSTSLLGAVALPVWAGDSGTFSLTTGFDYSSGKYGGTTATDITSVPVIAKYQVDRWVLKLTVPYITITGPGGVVPNIGQTQTITTTQRTTESGLGDIVAGASYNLLNGSSGMPVIDLTGKVKIGTADAAKGLGTGENDYTAQVDMYKGFGDFTALGTVGYRAYGDTSTTTLDNVFFGSVGGVYKLTPNTSTGLIYDYRPAITARGSSMSEMMAFVSQKITHNWKAQGYLVKGFSNGSPDYGVGALASYVF